MDATAEGHTVEQAVWVADDEGELTMALLV